MLSNCGVGEDSRIPWAERTSNQSILKEINPEYSLEGLMLKLKLQYCGHRMQRADALEKTLMLGKIEGRKRRGQWVRGGWMASPTQWTWVWASSRKWWKTGKPGVLQSMGSQRVGYDWATEQQHTYIYIYIHTNTHTHTHTHTRFVALGVKSEHCIASSTQSILFKPPTPFAIFGGNKLNHLRLRYKVSVSTFSFQTCRLTNFVGQNSK